MHSVNPVDIPFFTLKNSVSGIGDYFDERLLICLLLAVHRNLCKGCHYKLTSKFIYVIY